MNDQDHYRVVIIADTHIGAERRPWLQKMGIDRVKYDQPLGEALSWAAENEVDAFIVAGDLYDKRQPTPSDYLRGSVLRFAPDLLIVAGNHDTPITGVDALWNQTEVMRGTPSVRGLGNGLQIVGIPWPQLNHWPNDGTRRTIEHELAATRESVLKNVESIARDLDTSRPAIGVGHLMTSVGHVSAEGPGMMLGRDVLIPEEELKAIPNIGGWFLGHIHKPWHLYVGSTQPVDFGDTEPKSFTVVDITWNTKNQVWDYETRRIPYTTSLKLLDLKLENGDDYPELPDEADAIRVTVSVPEGQQFDDEKLILHLYQLTDQIEIIVNHEVKRAARVETAEPLAKMDPYSAYNTWIEQRDTAKADAVAIMSDVDKMIHGYES